MADRVWSEKDLVRRANRRLAVLRHAAEVSGNAATACRCYGISRTVFYRWKRRRDDEGIDGLKDRSSAPLHRPAITHPQVVEKIVHLRQHYHFGPLKIEMYLRRYLDQEIGASTIYRILKRLGMSRLPVSRRCRQRWKRYEKQRPGHQLQIDVKLVEPITDDAGRAKRFYQYTAIVNHQRQQHTQAVSEGVLARVTTGPAERWATESKAERVPRGTVACAVPDLVVGQGAMRCRRPSTVDGAFA
ncbi:hypothetical protein GCM10022222_06650 [Amycolatopsis ultiminotia]|uniref:Transposase n=1 Tax=Amycolatopsis ultiminotia TaxID=543629 RepID=A0ABP6V1U2_9PSEU